MMLGFWEGLSRICEHYGAPSSDTLITPTIDFSPHLASPRRGGTDTLGCLIFNGLPTSKSNLHLPYGGEREGADVCG